MHSACPASLRWTSPELLTHPTTRETVASLSSSTTTTTTGGTTIGGSGGNNSGRWKPAADQTNVITTRCDVYSFAMVMWELAFCRDPFQEIVSESQVGWFYSPFLCSIPDYLSISDIRLSSNEQLGVVAAYGGYHHDVDITQLTLY